MQTSKQPPLWDVQSSASDLRSVEQKTQIPTLTNQGPHFLEPQFPDPPPGIAEMMPTDERALSIRQARAGGEKGW